MNSKDKVLKGSTLWRELVSEANSPTNLQRILLKLYQQTFPNIDEFIDLAQNFLEEFSQTFPKVFRLVEVETVWDKVANHIRAVCHLNIAKTYSQSFKYLDEIHTFEKVLQNSDLNLVTSKPFSFYNNQSDVASLDVQNEMESGMDMI